MNRGKLEIDLDMKTKNFDYQIEKAQQKLNDLLATYKLMSEEDGFNAQSQEATQLRKEIEQTANSIVNLRKQQKQQQQESQKNWKENLKGIKNVALGIIGIRSAYNLARKASSAYLSQDTELAEKLQSVWVGLGSFLAPLLEKLSDLMLKAVGYINVFVKALTGVDYIANANAKALNKQAKAQANLNKQAQQYDFDVIRTQQEQTSGGGIDTGANGMINIPALDQGLVDKLQKLAYWLKENKTWIEAVGIGLIAAFGISNISKLVSNIGGLGKALGATSGLAGVLLYLDSIIVTKVLISMGELITNVKKLSDMNKNNTDLGWDIIKHTEEMGEAYWDLAQQGKANTEATEKYIKVLDNQVDEMKINADEINNLRSHVTTLITQSGEIADKQTLLSSQIRAVTDAYKKLKEENKLTEEQQKKYEDVLRESIELANKNGDAALDLKADYKELTGENYEMKVSITAEDKTQEGVNNAKWSLSRVFEGLGSFLTGRIHLSDYIAGRFATGGIVTQPTRALIGEAGYPEAVVPMQADYLSTLASEIAKYGNNSGGGTVNVYLDGKLIQRQISKVEENRKFATNG